MQKTKLLLSLAAAGVTSLSLSAQELDWAGRFEVTNGMTVRTSVVDGAGNIYTTGNFYNTVDFDPGPGVFNLTSAGQDDMYVCKLDASGNLVWAKSAGGTNSDSGNDIAFDPSGNIVVTGGFVGTVDFDPGPGAFNLTSAGGIDTYVLKLDAAGNFIWAKRAGGANTDNSLSLTVSTSGNVYVTGAFRATADFDPGPGTFNLTSAGNADAFVLKLDASGNFVWAKRMGSSDISWAEAGQGIAVDAAENVYSAGVFYTTCDFDPGAGTFTLTSAGQYDIYYQKLDAAGNFVWAKKIGGTGYEQVNDFVIDGAGNLYSTGQYDGTADFDPGAATVNLTAVGSNDIFVNKIDAAGNYVWARSAGSIDGNERGNSVTTDAAGNVYFTGVFWSVADFDPGAGVQNLTSAGYGDIFLAKYDASGNYVWAYSFGAPGNTFETGYNVVIGPSESIYALGTFQGTVDFDPGPGTTALTASSNIGTHTVYIQKLNQCTSVAQTENISACPPFTWRDGNTYTTSQTGITYTVDGAVSGGCDSVYTLNLTITPNTVALTSLSQSDITCFGSNDGVATVNPATGGAGNYTYDWLPGTPAGDGTTSITGLTPGTWTCTVTDANGCGAAQSFTITEPAAITGNFSQINCDSYTWNAQTYTTSGTYMQTFTAANGCDSTVTLSLTITNSTTGVDAVTACDSYVWIDGNTYTASNSSATHVLTNSAGCDSTVALNLTITNSTTGVDAITACDSYVWIDGNTYTASNSSATHVLTNSAGCDSTVTLNLTITNSTAGVDAVSACDSYVWIDGNTYTASNSSATHVLTNSAGCDSTVTLNLTITNSTTGVDAITACDSYVWIDGNTYTASNSSATHVLTNSAGCDSTVTLNLVITNSTTGTDVITACDSHVWIDGNTYTASNSSATHVLTNSAGCDSTVTLNLTITNSTTGVDAITACDSYVWIDGNTYTASNSSATHVLTNSAGCDSTVTLNLTITNSTTGVDAVTACDSYVWIDGNTYTASNSSATHVLTNSAGCDSTVTLNLTITNSTTGVDAITACDSYVWIDGNTYTASNSSATHVLTNSAGCDSTVTLNLTITNSTTGVDAITACDSYTWIDGVTYTTSNSSATYLLTNSSGCDSTVTLNLIINSAPAMTATDNGSGVITASSAASYQWIDCSTNQPIAGETGASLSVFANGTYAVIGYSAQQCADTSNCVAINYMSTTGLNAAVTLNIMPNPASDQVMITFNANVNQADLIIRDAQGKVVSATTVQSGETVSLQDLNAGVYFFELITAEGRSVKRVVKM